MSCESALRCSAIGSSFAISKHNALQHRVTARLVHVLGAGAAGAVVGSALFGQAAPEAFGAFDLAFFTLFRITAGEYPVEIAPAIAQGCIGGAPGATRYNTCYLESEGLWVEPVEGCARHCKQDLQFSVASHCAMERGASGVGLGDVSKGARSAECGSDTVKGYEQAESWRISAWQHRA